MSQASRARVCWPAIALVGGLVVPLAWAHLVIGARPEESLYAAWLMGAKIDVLVRGGQWWRLVTAPLVHLSWLHLSVNAIGLYVLGAWVNAIYGAPRLILSFGLTAIAGSISSLVWHKAGSLGASGAVFGMLGLLVGATAKRGRALPVKWWAGTRGYLVILLLGNALVLPLSTSTRVDHAAHVGGALMGAIVGVAMATHRARSRGITWASVGWVGLIVWAAWGAANHAALVGGRSVPYREIRADEPSIRYRVPSHWVPDASNCAHGHTNGLVDVCLSERFGERTPSAWRAALIAETSEVGFRPTADVHASISSIAVDAGGEWHGPLVFAPAQADLPDQRAILLFHPSPRGVWVVEARYQAPGKTRLIVAERLTQICRSVMARKS